MLSQEDVRLSVRPFVTRRYSVEMAKRILKLFSPLDSHTILVFPYQTLLLYSVDDSPPLRGDGRMHWGMKNSRFSTNILLHLGNDTRQSHSYYGSNVNRKPTETFVWHDFQFLRTTINQDFKVTPLFQAEYLRNGTR